MVGKTPQSQRAAAWELAKDQHGVVTRAQLRGLGFSDKAIEHRLARGRLHRVWRGVYAVGRPQLTALGCWMAAVLRCGDGAALSHASAAALWEIRPPCRGVIEVSVPADADPRPAGIRVHRRTNLPPDLAVCRGIAVTSPTRTLLDLATRLGRRRLEAAVNAADKQDLTDPETLREALPGFAGQPGVVTLRAVLDRRTFSLTDSELERRFLPLAREAGLSSPVTRCRVDGFRVDFFWPELGLVVETDGLRYHRTPAQQARDRLRDQTHTASGLTPLRFTHAQVRFEPARVQAVLASVARRLTSAS